MKTLITSLFALLLAMVSVSAQNYIEVIHLKSGEKVCGVIIENRAGEYITIQTDGGVLRNCPSSQVVRIEQRIATPRQVKQHQDIYSPQVVDTPKPKEPFHYQGFVEIGYGAVFGDTASESTYRKNMHCYGNYELSTTHGARRGCLFIGGGVALAYRSETGGGPVCVPVYFNIRLDNPKLRVSPMLDVKVGVCITDFIPGCYGSAHLGVNIGRFNIAAGVSAYVILPACAWISVGGRIGVRF